jgi:hypothetical protein
MSFHLSKAIKNKTLNTTKGISIKPNPKFLPTRNGSGRRNKMQSTRAIDGRRRWGAMVDTKSILKGGNEVNSLGVWWRREQGRAAAVAERAMVDKAHWELPGARGF